MKIVIDARFTRTDHHDGISRYGSSLIAATSKIADVTMLISDKRQLALLPDVPYVMLNSPPCHLWNCSSPARSTPPLVLTWWCVLCRPWAPWAAVMDWCLPFTTSFTMSTRLPPRLPASPPVRLLWRLYHKAFWPQRLLLDRADIVATISRTTEASWPSTN